jgi:hypothetical protein
MNVESIRRKKQRRLPPIWESFKVRLAYNVTVKSSNSRLGAVTPK